MERSGGRQAAIARSGIWWLVDSSINGGRFESLAASGLILFFRNDFYSEGDAERRHDPQLSETIGSVNPVPLSTS